MEEHHENHGHSVAAWTAVGIMLVGAAIASFAVAMPNMVLGIIGAVVIVIGAVAGKVLAMAGYGGKPHDSERESFIADAPDERGTATVGKS
jgi:multisubunit Na+/H+ antiporter MnhG subunit